MNGTALKVLTVAGLLFVSSCVAFVVGWRERFDPDDVGGALFDWTFILEGWTYREHVGCALLAASVGCASAAFRLKNQ